MGQLFQLNESAIYGNQPMIFKQEPTAKPADTKPKTSTELADSLSKGTTTPIKSKGTEKTPLGPLTIVDDNSDTLTFSSRRDSIAYDQINEHYLADWKKVDDKSLADWMKVDAKEDAAAKKGDLEGIKAAKAEKSAINKEEDAKKAEARKILGVTVRPWKDK